MCCHIRNQLIIIEILKRIGSEKSPTYHVYHIARVEFIRQLVFSGELRTDFVVPPLVMLTL